MTEGTIDAQEMIPATTSRVMVRMLLAQNDRYQQLTLHQSKIRTDHDHHDATAETTVDAHHLRHEVLPASAGHHRRAQTAIATSNAAGILLRAGLHHGDLMTGKHHVALSIPKVQREAR